MSWSWVCWRGGCDIDRRNDGVGKGDSFMTAVDKLISHMTFTDESPSAIRQTYLDRTPRSAEAFSAALRYMVGGVTRQAGYWAPYPITIEGGAGAEVWAADGHRYIDLISTYTSLIHRHA